MKSCTPLFLVLGALLGFAVNLHSQAPASKSPLDQVRAIKAKNAELIEKQQAVLIKLEEMDKQADQVRILSKRG